MSLPGGTYYSADSTLVVGSKLHFDSALTNPLPAGYYSDGSNCYQTDGSGIIIAITACAGAPITTTTTAQPTTTTTAQPTTTSTTIPTVTSFSLGEGFDAAGACLGAGFPTTYYSSSSLLGVGSVLYTDPALTTFAGNSFYSDGTTAYEITSNGVIASTSLCGGAPATTTTTADPGGTTTTTTAGGIPPAPAAVDCGGATLTQGIQITNNTAETISVSSAPSGLANCSLSDPENAPAGSYVAFNGAFTDTISFQFSALPVNAKAHVYKDNVYVTTISPLNINTAIFGYADAAGKIIKYLIFV